MDIEARPIGAVLPAIREGATRATASNAPLIDALPILDLASLPARLDDAILGQLDTIANCRLPELERCGDRHFIQCFRVMKAALPRRSADDLSGELLVAAYQRLLGSYPDEAISFLSEHALRECKWFPTIAECLSIIGRWERRDAAYQRAAAHRAQRERQARFDDVRARLRAGDVGQDEIDGWPDRWRRIFECECLLHRVENGSYVARKRIEGHGKTKNTTDEGAGSGGDTDDQCGSLG